MFYLFQENVKKTRNITKSFAGNDIHNVITPESEVIKKGPIAKISARNGKRQGRYLFLVCNKMHVSFCTLAGFDKISICSKTNTWQVDQKAIDL